MLAPYSSLRMANRLEKPVSPLPLIFLCEAQYKRCVAGSIAIERVVGLRVFGLFPEAAIHWVL